MFVRINDLFGESLLALSLPADFDSSRSDFVDRVHALIPNVGDRSNLFLVDAALPYPEGNTGVIVDGKRWSISQRGSVSEEMIRWHSACMVIFVCTGNTCRSPLAECL